MTPSPPYVPLERLDASLHDPGFAVLDAASFAQLAGVAISAFTSWHHFWNTLPLDEHLRDKGRYRRRRHSCFVVDHDRVERSPHRAHWQSLEYNALHGGIERWFEPMDTAMVDDPNWSRMLVSLARRASTLRQTSHPWFIEAHPFRIDTTLGIGRPTPEGAHRDGVDLVVVVLVGREGIKGGETRIFEADGPHGTRFVLNEPWSAVLLDDARVIHESTPIQPVTPSSTGHRDTLVVTFRRDGFQSAPGTEIDR